MTGPTSRGVNARIAELERRLLAAERLADHDPNPVLRIDRAGTLVYHNPASAPIIEGLGVAIGTALPDDLIDRIREAMAGPPDAMAELSVGDATYRLKPVDEPAIDSIDIYAVDVTATLALERFPEQNPAPVLRIDDDGRLRYANPASDAVVKALGVALDERLPEDLWSRLCAHATGASGDPVEIQGDGRWYELVCVPVAGMGFSNLYGRDVTASKALDGFPGRNPNPVMRISADGVLLYANPASDPIVSGFDMREGERVPATLLDPMRIDAASGACAFDIETDGRIYRMVAVEAFEFGFTNLYATDITAAREVEEAHRENERLLLSILPEPIALRLRSGEGVIADRFEDLSLMFADIVDFTRLSSTLAPHEVIDLLDDLFRHVDELVDRYRLEKIKTIGDAYMLVGGLPPEPEDHLARAADLALDLHAVLEERHPSPPIAMRVGLHAGPAVAGIIGSKRFIYDVWGDTVNTASRLESNGAPNRIQVSETVRDRLGERFVFEPHGIVDLKGKGPTPTWFLTGRRGADRADHAWTPA